MTKKHFLKKLAELVDSFENPTGQCMERTIGVRVTFPGDAADGTEEMVGWNGEGFRVVEK